jgi:nitrate/TMAO reductase-like tetraheme cytochrome c subunit
VADRADGGGPDQVRPPEKRPVLWFLTSHWVSVLGSSLVTIAGCSWLFILALHAGGQAANPYLGILNIFAIPAVFFLGLILIPIGAWLSRRRIRAGLAQAQSRPVVLRHLAVFFIAMTVVNVVIASQVTYRAVTHMETEQFCGQSCHVMKPQFTANQRNVHRKVGCVDCHVVPGAAGFVEAKMSGTRQLLEVTLNDYPRPIPPALQTDRLASSAETCEQCHARTIYSGSKLLVFSRFKDDEANTPTQTVLMMNVGGGRAGGIHGAHMGPGVEIRYRTTDPDRQVIPWVEYRNSDTGKTRTYTAAGVSDAGAREFTMQCADCHNLAGHALDSPEGAVDRAMAAGRFPVGLPFAHKTGVEILKASYSSDDDASRKIPAAFAAFYQGKYPDVAAKRAAEIKSAGETLASLYEDNVFPDLGVKWGTYKDNLGHADNAGCFRCHDENHATPEKKTITQDCSVCHNPISVDETAPAVLKTLGLDQTLSMRLKQ